MASDDPFVRHAALRAMRKAWSTETLVVLQNSGERHHRLASVLLLRGSADPKAIAAIPRFLTDTDPDIRFAAVQWIGEHNLSQFRPQLMDVLGAGGVTKQLFEGTLAALERLDGKVRGPTQEVTGDRYVLEILVKSTTPDPFAPAPCV